MAVDFTATPDVAGHTAPQQRIKELWDAMGGDGSDMVYDNSDADLDATNVKDALDELADRCLAIETAATALAVRVAALEA